MLILGLILIVIAALALLAAIVGGSNDPATLAMGGVQWHTNAMWLFLGGALSLLVLVVGLDLLRNGLRRAHQRRKDAKELNRLSAKLERQEEEKRLREDTRGTDTVADSDTEVTREHGAHRDPETREI